MIEMVFVIVILGILAAVAIPRLAASRDDAIVVKGQSQVSAIRSGISLQKSKNLLKSQLNDCSGGLKTYYPCLLDDNITSPSSDDAKLFFIASGNENNILEYPLYSKQAHDGSWRKLTSLTFEYYLSGNPIEFTYTPSNGSFDCNSTTGATGAEGCKLLSR